MTEQTLPKLGLILALVSTLFWGLGAYFSKVGQTGKVNPFDVYFSGALGTILVASIIFISFQAFRAHWLSALIAFSFLATAILASFAIARYDLGTLLFGGTHISMWGLLMGATWGGGTVLYIFALQFGKLVVISPLTALYPVVAIVLAVVFLREKLSMTEVIAVILALSSGLLLGWPKNSP